MFTDYGDLAGGEEAGKIDGLEIVAKTEAERGLLESLAQTTA